MTRILMTVVVAVMSTPSMAETYACNDSFLTFSLKRVALSETETVFQHKTRDETPYYKTIVKETSNHIYLAVFRNGGASHGIVGKKDGSYVAVWLEHEGSSEVFDGECYVVD